jgi:Uma2 family endonuclease
LKLKVLFLLFLCLAFSPFPWLQSEERIFMAKIMYTLTKWSLSDYHKIIEAGILSDRRVELILGDIVEMSPEGPMHRYINHTTVKYLRTVLKNRAEVIEAHPITLGDSEPEPDIAIVRSPDGLYLTRHPYPEDIYWLIEIADTTLTKDLGIKKKAYAQAGISEYWVIDLSSSTLKVFLNPIEEDYQTKYEYHDGMIYPQAFSDIEIMVKRLLNVEN